MKNRISLPVLTGIFIATALLTVADDSQPISQTSPSGDQYLAYDDNTGDLTISTSTLPNPDCPDDVAAAPAQYFWDFGPDLDATDNGDGSAVIHTDVEASYIINVYCQQSFTRASDGTSYFEETQNSNTPPSGS